MELCKYLNKVCRTEDIQSTVSLALELFKEQLSLSEHNSMNKQLAQLELPYSQEHTTTGLEISLNHQDTPMLVYLLIALLVREQLNALQAAHKEGLVPLLKQQHESLTGLTAHSSSFQLKQCQGAEQLKEFTEQLTRKIDSDQEWSVAIEKLLKGKLAVREGLAMTLKLLTRKAEVASEDPNPLFDQHRELEAEYLALNEESETIAQHMEAAAKSFTRELEALKVQHSEKTRLLIELQTENSQLRAAERLRDSLQARLSLSRQQSAPVPPPEDSTTEFQLIQLEQELLCEESNCFKLSELTQELEFLSDSTLRTAETQCVAQRVLILQQERAKECAAVLKQLTLSIP